MNRKENINSVEKHGLEASQVNAQPSQQIEQKWKLLDYEEGYRNCQYPLNEYLTCAKTGELALLLNLTTKERKWVCLKHLKVYSKESPIVLLDEFEKKSKLTKIQGILTSGIRTKKSSNVDYMAFVRESTNNKHSLEECIAEKCKDCEIPVVFRIKDRECDSSHHILSTGVCYLKPNLKKGDLVSLAGEFSESEKSNRPSFTCYSYQIIKDYE